MDFEPKIFRTIVFIRHGQYQKNPEKLTKLGRHQAKIAAKAIAPLNPSKIYCSTMPRAKETAHIISSHIKLTPRAKSFFCEGLLPGTVSFFNLITKKSSKAEKIKTKRKMKKAKLVADNAFKFLFQPPKTDATCELVVAHGNVIRHWVCKALKIDSEKWLSMDVSHASLTTIRIDKKGHFVILGFSDSGHLPHNKRTYV